MALSHLTRIAAVAATVVLAATACGGGSPSGSSGGSPSVAQNASFPAGSTMAALNTAQALRLGTKFDQPLFGLKGLDGNPAGFDVEIAKIIAGKLGIPADKITYTETPSAVREEVIEQARVDIVVATYTINDMRKERVTFAGPYYEAGQDLMVKTDNTTITGPESLRGANARVCSVAGSTPSEKIKEFIDPANLTLFDVYSKCADALRTGQIDVVTTDNTILTGLIENSGGAFKLVNKTFTEEPYGIGVKKGDVAFCEFINQTLMEAEADGSYKAAWDATLAKVSPEVRPIPALGTCS